MLVLTAVAGVAEGAGAGQLPRFVLSGLALAGSAAVIGLAIDQVGERLGATATGLLQSTLGNLPELLVGLFALHRGLAGVVRAALAGSILANAVLVLGFVFLTGGLRHGTQRFDPEQPRLNAALLLLVVAAMTVPTLAQHLNTPAAAHIRGLSDACAVFLLIVYAATVVFSLHRAGDQRQKPGEGGATWPLRQSIATLVVASGAAALASDWFTNALVPATRSLGLSQTFTGVVVVALAANAVEHAVGIRFAIKGKAQLAIESTLASPLQVALLLTPALVLLSPAVGTTMTLAFPPLMVAALAVSALVVIAVVYDGEYTWIEGVALIGLYCIVAAGFWWG
jgi:Ca2+:H+ antiporter